MAELCVPADAGIGPRRPGAFRGGPERVEDAAAVGAQRAVDGPARSHDRDTRPGDLPCHLRQPGGDLRAVGDEHEGDGAVAFDHGDHSTMSNGIRQ